MNTRTVLTTIIAAGLLAAPGLADPAPANSPNPDVQFARSLSNAFAQAASRIEPSVVHITSQERMALVRRDIYGRQYSTGDPVERPLGLGSGVIIDDAGHIVTNAHVVTVDERTRNYADRLIVRLSDGREYEADLVGVDPGTDIAVLTIQADGLVPAAWADSENAAVGQWVLAVGSPFGFDQTVTAGIISSKGRPTINPMANNANYFDQSRFQEFIQTDAAINPGNSGGPLVDLEGHIVGINTAIASRSGGNEGLGFAIPADLAHAVSDRLIQTGRVDRGYLGIEWNADQPSIDPERARKLGIAGGVEIASVVEHGPADDAGLKPGDVIIRFAGRTTENANRLRNAIAITPPGADVEIVYYRGDTQRTGHARVVDRQTGLAIADNATQIPSLGVVVSTSTLTVSRAGRDVGERIGAQILDVTPGGAADQVGLEVGDVILEVDGRELDDLKDLTKRVEPSDLESGVTLSIFRPSPTGRGGLTGQVEIKTGS
ncbi:MAG: trypsin-like peptidase domain-containing protein [Phycisphaerales bacterium]